MGKLTFFIVYVDDIIVTREEVTEYIERLKKKLALEIKDLGRLMYFLGIEVDHSRKGIFISQKKYILDLKEISMLGCKFCKPTNTPIEQNHKLGEAQ